MSSGQICRNWLPPGFINLQKTQYKKQNTVFLKKKSMHYLAEKLGNRDSF